MLPDVTFLVIYPKKTFCDHTPDMRSIDLSHNRNYVFTSAPFECLEHLTVLRINDTVQNCDADRVRWIVGLPPGTVIGNECDPLPESSLASGNTIQYCFLFFWHYLTEPYFRYFIFSFYWMASFETIIVFRFFFWFGMFDGLYFCSFHLIWRINLTNCFNTAFQRENFRWNTNYWSKYIQSYTHPFELSSIK